MGWFYSQQMKSITHTHTQKHTITLSTFAVRHHARYNYVQEDKSLREGRQKADWQRVSPAAKLRGGAGEGERRIIKPSTNLETPAAPARGAQEHLPLTPDALSCSLFLLIIQTTSSFSRFTDAKTKRQQCQTPSNVNMFGVELQGRSLYICCASCSHTFYEHQQRMPIFLK